MATKNILNKQSCLKWGQLVVREAKQSHPALLNVKDTHYFPNIMREFPLILLKGHKAALPWCYT